MRDDDAELIDKYLSGDRATLDLIDRWIVRAAWPYRHRLGDSWEDILQDIRLELTRLLRVGAFRGESRLKTYLWRVANHACLDRLRAFGRRKIADIEDAQPDLDFDELLRFQRSSRYEDRDLMKRVWAELSEESRTLFKHLVSGRSYAEMSELLGISEGTLRVRVLRARKRATAIRRQLTADKQN
ncbi:MAG: RNA polymerase sigma factor [Acidobacteriota bacterium]